MGHVKQSIILEESDRSLLRFLALSYVSDYYRGFHFIGCYVSTVQFILRTDTRTTYKHGDVLAMIGLSTYEFLELDSNFDNFYRKYKNFRFSVQVASTCEITATPNLKFLFWAAYDEAGKWSIHFLSGVFSHGSVAIWERYKLNHASHTTYPMFSHLLVAILFITFTLQCF